MVESSHNYEKKKRKFNFFSLGFLGKQTEMKILQINENVMRQCRFSHLVMVFGSDLRGSELHRNRQRQ